MADAMTGQDAVRSAEEFHKRVGITGIVLTKLDGDARGGAALSAASVTGTPVKFAGLGEKVDGFEVARRIKADPALAATTVIMLTARGQAIDREEGFAAGANEYLTKPFDPDDLLRRARTALGL